MIGQTIAHYKITAKLGSGGMGEVYLADDTKLDRKVALKFLPESLSKDPEARERLIREARAASKISHSNIVTIFAVENADGRDFIAMEYIDGRPLDDYLAEKPRTLDEILRVAVQIGRALEHAHKAGIVHRDLKPGNIFIDREDRVRILDFGLARLPGADRLTKTGSTLGTISYMAPEQVEGKDADERSDIFSFGILLYEMLTGQLPFAGDHHAAIMYSILNESPRPLTDFRSDLPPAVIGIVNKALEKNPLSRYATATDMTAELRRERDARASGPSQVHIPALAPKRSLPRYVVPTVIAAAIVVLILVFKPWSIQVSPTQEAEAVADRLAVMYFDNIADPDDPKRYGEIASNLLIADLSESQRMQIISSQRLYDILKQLGREGQKKVDHDIATEVAAKARARWMLMGTILQSEPHFVITSQVVESSSGTTVASQMLEGNDGESIFALVGRLAKEITSDLSIPEPTDAGTSMTIEASTSTDAYRHYLNGVDLDRKSYYLDANKEYKQAIAIDSTFALAYFRLYSNGSGTTKESEYWLNQAKRYADRLGRRDRLLIESFLTRRDKGYRAQIPLLEQIHREFPDDKEVMQILAGTYRVTAKPAQALAISQQLLAVDSLDKGTYNELAYIYDDLGDFEHALNSINRYIQLAPDEANPYDSRGDLYGNHGKFQEARESFARSVAINPNFVQSAIKYGFVSLILRDFDAAESCFTAMTAHPDREFRSRGREGLAFIPAHHGRLRKALEILDTGIEADRMEQYTGWPYISKLYDKFKLLLALGENERALAALRQDRDASEAMQPLSSWWMLNYFALLEDRLGHTAAADSIMVERYKQIQSRDTASIGNYYYGHLMLATQRDDKGQIRAYLDSLILRMPKPTHDFYGKAALAEGYLALSQPADAIPLIEGLLGEFNDDNATNAPKYITLHYDLARAYEMSGWTDKAIAQYELFLALFDDPDPELKEIPDAKNRIAKLRAGA